MTPIDLEAARRYYYEREARRRARREAERQQWLQRAREAIQRLAGRYPDIQRVYLFGSVMQPGRFLSDSDIDVAVECDAPEVESAFWHTLEHELGRPVDLHPLAGALAEAVIAAGELVHERENPYPGE